MLWGLIATVYIAICLSLICRKMGFPPIIGVLTLIPAFGWLLFLGLLWYMAFAGWPRWPDGARLSRDG